MSPPCHRHVAGMSRHNVAAVGQHYYAAIFAKVFGVSDKNVILNCQYFSGYLPFSDLLDLKKIKFMDGVKTSENYSLKLLFNILNRSEYQALLEKHKLCSANSRPNAYKYIVWQNFESLINF